jgi:4-hydroxybenzoate polyprenyltransferase
MQQRRDDGGAPPGGRLPADAAVPVVVAADTMVAGASLLIVALSLYLKPALVRILHVAAWLLRGRYHIECKLAGAGAVPDADLALHPPVLDLADRAAAEGRAVYLAVRRRSPLLEAAVAGRPSIAGVIVDGAASRGAPGLKQFRDRFPGGYDVVTSLGGALTITHHPTPAMPDAATPLEPTTAPLPRGFRAPSVVREIIKSLRLHQCVKNLIVFVPVILGGRLTDLTEIADALVAFVALSLVASGTYLVNDIWDIADDRKHWSKKDRPVAAGRLPAAAALTAAVCLVAAGLLLGMRVSWATGLMLLLYLALTLWYTLHLKAAPFVDGLALAALFTIRLGIGAAAANVPPSPWLFVFSMFLFSSLSYAKRHTEIARAIVHRASGMNGRGYRLADAPMVLTVGLSTGVGAVVIMVLYIVEEAFRSSFYGSTGWLWGFPPLIFLFVVRIWVVSVREEMHDDPVAFAIGDRLCIGLLALLLVCFGFAWLG